ncbi:MAG: nucleotidyl transferase AbiEii/AbiGii toxin family protein [Myxococcales bacterium]|nr:nucleotidyl transferase AbiEii/AbiGii toxin family protein [Myxococcales bacterium]
MSDDLFTLFCSPLRAAGIEAMVTGGVAAMIYGEPRLTTDIDLVVALDEDRVPALVEAFPEAEYLRPPLELLRLEARRAARGRVTLIHRQTELSADLHLLGEDPLHQWAWPRAREVVVRGAALRVAPPEYVVVRKLEALREHARGEHLRDLRTILHQHGDELERNELASQIVRLGLQPQWAEVVQSLQAS